jgi:hypothetical protein
LATKEEIANFITEPYIVQKLTNDNKLLPSYVSTPADEGKYVTILYKDGKWVAGYIPVSFIYVGAELPTSDIGVDGDIYL